MKTQSIRFLIALAATFILLPSTFVLAQGPLTPPGAPAPTMKTLTQIEPRTPISSLPFTILASGWTDVTGNLTTTPGGDGILIAASNVTLDLGGFELIGNVAGGGSGFGIRVSVPQTNVTIRNGTVRNWPGTGVGAGAPNCELMHLEKVRAVDCGSTGIVLGNRGTAIDCVARGNGGNGFSGSTASRFTRCTASQNTGDGIAGGNDAIVSECVGIVNTAIGIRVSDDGTLRDCVASGNGGPGFFGFVNLTASGCTARSNSAEGFILNSVGTLSHCTGDSNGADGIRADQGANLQGCMMLANAGSGISVGPGSTVVGCTVRSNQGDSGLSVGDGSVVSGCTAADNTGTHGIRAGVGSTLTNLQCAQQRRRIRYPGHDRSTLTNCTAGVNTSAATDSWGISAGNFCTVSNCTASGNLNTPGRPAIPQEAVSWQAEAPQFRIAPWSATKAMASRSAEIPAWSGTTATAMGTVGMPPASIP